MSRARWTSLLICVSCVTGGAAWGKAPEVRIIAPPDGITVSVGQAVPFEASTATDDTERSAPKVQWLWDFGDKATSDKNPTTHAYGEAGLYKATVTATTDDGTAAASVEVIVTSGEGGTRQVGDSLYIRESAVDPVTHTKKTVDDDEACDGIEVVFETTNMVMNTPTLEKKVPGGTWQAAGTATEEPTGIPGTRRWVWGWPTWGEKNWGIEFRVQYRKPPMPGTLVTVDPKTFTVTNTVVDGTEELLLWNGTDAVTVPWNIVHCPHRAPKFSVAVSIMPVGSTLVIKDYSLTNQDPGEGSLQWQGETTAGGTAPPGVYTYTVCATHVHPGQTCTDTDKSTSLTISNVTLSGFEWVPDTDPPQAQVLVQYDLSSAAASCGIKVYPPCLGPAPVVFPSEGNLGSDRGHHIQSVRLQVCPTHMGPYAFALCAGETTASGQEHRGRAAKPALPRGAGMAIWPPAYGGAGDDGPGSPYNDDLSGAVAEFQQQLGIPQGLGGLHWAPASGAGPDQVDAVFARMSEGPAAVVYAAAHATSHLLDFEDGRVLDLEYVLSDCTIPDSQASHAISELQGNDLRECLLVMFQGCHTATGHILSDAVVGKGAQAFVGFEGEPLLEYHDEFAHGFWPMASQPGKDLAEALDLAVDYLLVVKGASGGFETMWCTDASLELFPPRFSGPCVRAR